MIVFAVVGTVVVDQNGHRQRFSRAAAAGQSNGLTAGSLGNEATCLGKGQFHVRIEDLPGTFLADKGAGLRLPSLNIAARVIVCHVDAGCGHAPRVLAALMGTVCGFHRFRVAANFGVLRMMGTGMGQPRDWIIRFIGQGRGRQHGKNHAEG